MGNVTVLHFRRLADFEPAVDDWLTEQFEAARDLFLTRAGKQLILGSDLRLPLSVGNGSGIVNVEQCQLTGSPTPDQTMIFETAADLPADEIVVFVATDFTPWDGAGCAWHPTGILGCMVTLGELGLAEWKLAHELGHVLGLGHVDKSTRLMYPSALWKMEPPILSRQEADFLKGIGPRPMPSDDGSLGLSDESVTRVLNAIEPDYRRLRRFGSKVVPFLERFYGDTEDPAYRSRAVYALSLVSKEFDRVLLSAATSPHAKLRRAAAAASGALLPRALGKRLLLQLFRDPDPTVRYVSSRYIPVSSRGREIGARSLRTSATRIGAIDTPCDGGGAELTPTSIVLEASDETFFSFLMCKSTARVQVSLVLHEAERQLLADERGKEKVSLRIPRLPVGRHLLYWRFQEAGFEWRTRAEVSVNGTCRFRHRKTSDGSEPTNTGFIVLDVVEGHHERPRNVRVGELVPGRRTRPRAGTANSS